MSWCYVGTLEIHAPGNPSLPNARSFGNRFPFLCYLNFISGLFVDFLCVSLNGQPQLKLWQKTNKKTSQYIEHVTRVRLIPRAHPTARPNFFSLSFFHSHFYSIDLKNHFFLSKRGEGELGGIDRPSKFQSEVVGKINAKKLVKAHICVRQIKRRDKSARVMALLFVRMTDLSVRLTQLSRFKFFSQRR